MYFSKPGLIRAFKLRLIVFNRPNPTTQLFHLIMLDLFLSFKTYPAGIRSGIILTHDTDGQALLGYDLCCAAERIPDISFTAVLEIEPQTYLGNLAIKGNTPAASSFGSFLHMVIRQDTFLFLRDQYKGQDSRRRRTVKLASGRRICI